jgi:hypothetical protein
VKSLWHNDGVNHLRRHQFHQHPASSRHQFSRSGCPSCPQRVISIKRMGVSRRTILDRRRAVRKMMVIQFFQHGFTVRGTVTDQVQVRKKIF